MRSTLLPLLPFGAMADSGTGPGAAGRGELGVAALLPVRPAPGGRGYGELEIAVRGFGPRGAGLAGHLAARVLTWDELGRPGASSLRLNAYPVGAPEAAPPALPADTGQLILDRRHTRLALSWPAR